MGYRRTRVSSNSSSPGWNLATLGKSQEQVGHVGAFLATPVPEPASATVRSRGLGTPAFQEARSSLILTGEPTARNVLAKSE